METSAFMGGFAPNLWVLVYPWQAARYNSFLRRASYYLPREQVPAFSTEEEDAYEEDDVESLYLAPLVALPVGGPARPAAAVRSGQARAHWIVPTDRGDIHFSIDALVPCLAGERFIDVPVTGLKPGDTIVVRSDGAPIDARKQVDALDEIHPAFAEAAQAASLWWGLLKAFAKASGPEEGGADAFYESIFPQHEVHPDTLDRWLSRTGGRDQEGNAMKLIGPNNENIRLLLSRIGLPDDVISELSRHVRQYRSWRMRAYQHLYKLRAVKTGSIWASVGLTPEAKSSEDEVVDSELNITLSTLEDLTAFVKVLQAPRMEGALD
jgi:hypothetical protein